MAREAIDASADYFSMSFNAAVAVIFRHHLLNKFQIYLSENYYG